MKRIAFLVGGWMLGLSLVAHAAEIRRESTFERPYIIELGEPYRINESRLDKEIKVNSDLREYVGFYGYPEVAEIQEVVPQPPWAHYEVRLHYIKRRLTIAFARAYIAPTVVDFGLLRYEAELTDDMIARLSAQPGPANGGALDRVVAAADRAALAAERAEADSLAAQKAAERAANASERLEKTFHESVRK